MHSPFRFTNIAQGAQLELGSLEHLHKYSIHRIPLFTVLGEAVLKDLMLERSWQLGPLELCREGEFQFGLGDLELITKAGESYMW